MSQYLTAAEYRNLGLPAAALEEIADATIDAHIQAVCGKIDSYLASRATLPLSSPYPDVLRRVAADLTNWHLLLWRGYNPETFDQGYKQAHDEAIAWLEAVASGKVTIPGLIDETPTVREGRPRVSTSALRGW